MDGWTVGRKSPGDPVLRTPAVLIPNFNRILAFSYIINLQNTLTKGTFWKNSLWKIHFGNRNLKAVGHSFQKI